MHDHAPLNPHDDAHAHDAHDHDAHDHDHSHGHDPHAHSHVPSGRRALAVVFAVTFSVFFAEVVGALWSGSLALLTDAGHMMVDSTGLVVALVAAHLMARPRTDTHTWGYLRSEVLAATLQAGMLMVICVAVAIEGVHRLLSPEPVLTGIMLIFAVIGLAGNLISLSILLGSRHENLNLRAAFLEVATDTFGSVAVIAAALVARFTGWPYADAVASLLIAALMFPRAAHLLAQSVRILMAAAPKELDLAEVRRHILEVEHVVDCHDLHAVTVATGVISLSAHVTVGEECMRDGHAVRILHELQDCVASHFPVSIKHSTFQLDTPTHAGHEVLNH